MPVETSPIAAPAQRRHTLTRNNLELAGIVTFLFVLAIIFTIALTVMLFRLEVGHNTRPAPYPAPLYAFPDEG
ncbi:MAG TPA: hypothetical protein VGG85_00530 [Terracidiphilus sp.]|jgi:hypothetical protein